MTKLSTEQADTQLDKFKELARELECDEDEETFDEALRKIAKAPKGPIGKKPD